MVEPIKTVVSTPTFTADRGGPAAQAPSAPARTAPEQGEEPLRLVVEPARGAGQGYTYKLFDRSTGQLLIELPREQADKLSESPAYTARQVFSTRA